MRLTASLPLSEAQVRLKCRTLVLAKWYPAFTLLGQALGSVVLTAEALVRCTPERFVDTAVRSLPGRARQPPSTTLVRCNHADGSRVMGGWVMRIRSDPCSAIASRSRSCALRDKGLGFLRPGERSEPRGACCR